VLHYRQHWGDPGASQTRVELAALLADLPGRIDVPDVRDAAALINA